MIFLDIDTVFQSQVEPASLEQTAQAVIQHQRDDLAASLTIVITSNEKVLSLNQQYRGIHAPTDVLSFPAGYTDPESEQYYLGDIIIAYPTAAQQAEKAGHPVAAELALLVIHGVLHLFGHDHAEPDEKAEMWAAQTALLNQLQVPIRSILED